MVAGQELHEATGQILISHEVLDQVEETLLGAGRTQNGLQRDESLLFLRSNLLPLGEKLPSGSDRAHLGVGAIREDEEAIGDEEVRDGVA